MSQEKVFVKDRFIGLVSDGIFPQNITDRHIYRRLNAKGMDLDLHQTLKGRCHTWRLTHMKTGKVLEIDFNKIEIVGQRVDFGQIGRQYMVPLSEFTEARPEIQRRLF